MAGLEIAQGAYIALVNNDAHPHKIWLENLIQPMLKDHTIGICASKLIFENPQTVNSAGDGLTTGVGFNRGLGQDAAQFDVPPSPSLAPVEPAAYTGGACSTRSAFWMRISFFTMRTRISISVLNWLVGSVSMFLPRLSTTWPMRRLSG